MHNQPVETVESIPTEKLRAALLQAATPGVFGKVSLRHIPGFESGPSFVIATKISYPVTLPKTRPSTAALDRLRQRTRHDAVESALSFFRKRTTPVTDLMCADFHFADGELVKYDVEHVR